MDLFVQDIRRAIRTFWRDRRFNTAASAILALCIGSNVAAFTLVRSVLHRALPFPDAERIVLIADQYPGFNGGQATTTSSLPHYLDRVAAVSVVEGHGVYLPSRGTVDINGIPERVREMTVSTSFFRVLQADAALGRVFLDGDAAIGATNAVVLSFALWQQMHGGDPTVVGARMRLNGLPATIVGIMPEGFTFIDPEVQLWIPMTPDGVDTGGIAARHFGEWTHIARLRPGVRIEQLRAEVAPLTSAEIDRYPQFTEMLSNAGYDTTVETLRDVLVRDVRSTIYFVWGAAGLILLIGVVNVGGLAVARSVLRRKEYGTRKAIGASGRRIFAELLAESAPLAVVAGAAGLAIGRLLLELVPGIAQIPRADEIGLDAVVVSAAAAVSVLAGIGIAAVQSLRFTRMRLGQVLSEESRSGTAGTRVGILRRTLVVTQVALACVLLTGAGLLVRSFQNVLDEDPGFEPERVLTAAISPTTEPRPDLFIDRVLDSVRTIPGVESAGATSNLPFGSEAEGIVLVEDRTVEAGEALPTVWAARITPGYLETMDIALRRGRHFDSRDVAGSPPVAIVDERLAAFFWPDQDAIGRRMYLPEDADNSQRPMASTPFITVVGTVENVIHDDLAAGDALSGTYYAPYAQSRGRTVTLVVGTRLDPDSLTSAIRAELAAIAPQYPLFDVASMTDRLDGSLVSRRLALWLAGAFAVMALSLSVVGVFGIVDYLVTERTRELGVRIALGSPRSRVFWLMFRQGCGLVGTGLGIGLVLAYFSRRLIESQVYGVTAADPPTILGAAIVLGGCALAACLGPARRAAKVDPARILKGA